MGASAAADAAADEDEEEDEDEDSYATTLAPSAAGGAAPTPAHRRPAARLARGPAAARCPRCPRGQQDAAAADLQAARAAARGWERAGRAAGGGGGHAGGGAAAARAAARAARGVRAGGGGGGVGGGGGAAAAYALQRGIIRTNCIDCLDRTNVAQFCVGRTLLRRQLSTLGFVLSTDVLEIANALLMRMYEDMGTQLALQYGGSQAVGTPNSNAARDFLQSVKRFYRNTFTDTEKQMIFDVFLGVFPPALSGGTHIWDLDSDLHLHNRPPAHRAVLPEAS